MFVNTYIFVKRKVDVYKKISLIFKKLLVYYYFIKFPRTLNNIFIIFDYLLKCSNLTKTKAFS